MTDDSRRVERSTRNRPAEAIDLPILPTVVARLVAIDPDSDEYFDEILALAETDPPFAVKIIAMANSASSAPTQPIQTVRDAVMRLGAKRIGTIVTSLAVMNVFVPTTAAQKDLWFHSVAVAHGARIIAMAKELEPGLFEEAFLGGLLHDIGEFILLQVPSTSTQDEAPPGPAPDADAKPALGQDESQDVHVRLGYETLKRWGIPKTVCEVVRLHHVYSEELPDDQSHDSTAVISAVQQSDLLSSSLRSRSFLEQLEPPEVQRCVSEESIPSGCEARFIPPSVIRDLAPQIAESSARACRDMGLGRGYEWLELIDSARKASDGYEI